MRNLDIFEGIKNDLALNFFNRKILFSVFIVISIIIVFFLNHKIKTDISYHAGKDNGYFKRFESIVFLNILFFLFMSKNKKIIFTILGFFNAIIISFFGLIIANYFPSPLDEGGFRHFLILVLSYISFFAIEKLINNKIQIKNNIK